MNAAKLWCIKHKNILIIYFFFFLLCLFYLLFFIFRWTETKKVLDSFYEDGFAISFAASFVEDLIVFSTLSTVVIILTTKKLIDFSYNEKVTALVNSDVCVNNSEIEDFLKKEVSKLTIYDRELSFELIVADYSSDESAYKLVMESSHIICNMCKDQGYQLEDQYFRVTPSDVVVRDEIGRINFLEVINQKTKVIVPIVDRKSPFNLDKLYEEKLRLDISKNSEVRLNLNYTTWSKTSDICDKDDLTYWNYVKCNRFTQNIKITLKSQLNEHLKYTICTYSDNELKENSIHLLHEDIVLPGGKKLLEIPNSLFPGDDFRIFFHKPQKKE